MGNFLQNRLKSKIALLSLLLVLTMTIVAQGASYPAWDGDTVYTGGEKVSYNNSIWEAKWWTKGNEPGASQWGPWKLIEGDGGNDNPTVPATPTGLSTTIAGTSQIDISWNAVTEATDYDLKVDGVIVSDVTSPYSDTGLQAESTHSYQVRAKNEAGASAWSSEVTAITDADSNNDGNDGNDDVIQHVDPMPNTERKVLTDAEITARYGELNPNFTPEKMEAGIREILDAQLYEEMFPHRYGSDYSNDVMGNNQPDILTLENLISGAKELAKYVVREEVKNYARKVYRLNKVTKEEVVIWEDKDFDASWLSDVEPVVTVADYGAFMVQGDLETRKRELAAFFANTSHETTGGWETAPGGQYSWGHYYIEEMGCDDDTVGLYTDQNHEYSPHVSYHGRGIKQLSWNYNYKFFSSFIYDDASILLNEPQRVVHDGKLLMQSAVWFWMTPQHPKPSCHDIMAGVWEPTAEDIAANRLPGFGATINVINGGLEAGRPNDSRVLDRIGFFERYTQMLGVDTGQNVDCFDQDPWN